MYANLHSARELAFLDRVAKLRAGGLAEQDAFHALNMGLGMLVVLPPDAAAGALRVLPQARLVGEVVAGEGVSLV